MKSQYQDMHSDIPTFIFDLQDRVSKLQMQYSSFVRNCTDLIKSHLTSMDQDLKSDPNTPRELIVLVHEHGKRLKKRIEAASNTIEIQSPQIATTSLLNSYCNQITLLLKQKSSEKSKINKINSIFTDIEYIISSQYIEKEEHNKALKELSDKTSDLQSKLNEKNNSFQSLAQQFGKLKKTQESSSLNLTSHCNSNPESHVESFWLSRISSPIVSSSLPVLKEFKSSDYNDFIDFTKQKLEVLGKQVKNLLDLGYKLQKIIINDHPELSSIMKVFENNREEIEKVIEDIATPRFQLPSPLSPRDNYKITLENKIKDLKHEIKVILKDKSVKETEIIKLKQNYDRLSLENKNLILEAKENKEKLDEYLMENNNLKSDIQDLILENKKHEKNLRNLNNDLEYSIKSHEETKKNYENYLKSPKVNLNLARISQIQIKPLTSPINDKEIQILLHEKASKLNQPTKSPEKNKQLANSNSTPSKMFLSKIPKLKNEGLEITKSPLNSPRSKNTHSYTQVPSSKAANSLKIEIEPFKHDSNQYNPNNIDLNCKLSLKPDKALNLTKTSEFFINIPPDLRKINMEKQEIINKLTIEYENKLNCILDNQKLNYEHQIEQLQNQVLRLKHNNQKDLINDNLKIQEKIIDQTKLTKELSEKDKTISSIKENLDNAISQTEVINKKSEEKDYQILELKNKIVSLEDNLQKTEKNLSELICQLSSTSKALQEKENVIKDYQAALKTSEKTLKDKENHLKVLSSKQNSLETDCKDKETLIKASNEIITLLKESSLEKDETIKQLTSSQALMRSKYNEKLSEALHLESENKKLAATQEKLLNQLNNQTEELILLKFKEDEDLLNNIEDSDSQYRALQDQISKYKAIEFDLNKTLTEMLDKNNVLEAALEEALNRLEALQKDNAQLNSQLFAFETCSQDAQEIQKLRTKIAELEEKALENDFDQALAGPDPFAAQIEDLNDKCRMLEKKNAQTESFYIKEIKNLQQKIDLCTKKDLETHPSQTIPEPGLKTIENSPYEVVKAVNYDGITWFLLKYIEDNLYAWTSSNIPTDIKDETPLLIEKHQILKGNYNKLLEDYKKLKNIIESIDNICRKNGNQQVLELLLGPQSPRNALTPLNSSRDYSIEQFLEDLKSARSHFCEFEEESFEELSSKIISEEKSLFDASSYEKSCDCYTDIEKLNAIIDEKNKEIEDKQKTIRKHELALIELKEKYNRNIINYELH